MKPAHQAVNHTQVSHSIIQLHKVLNLHPEATVVGVTFFNVLDREVMPFISCHINAILLFIRQCHLFF